MPNHLVQQTPGRKSDPTGASPSLRQDEAKEAKEAKEIKEAQQELNTFTAAAGNREMQLSRSLGVDEQRCALHPYVQLLSIADLDSCHALENAAFPEHMRGSREKLAYRLSACPTLTLGLFGTPTNPPTASTREVYAAARPPDSNDPSHTAVLLGHVLGTLTTAPAITEASMQVPPGFCLDAPSFESQDEHLGHNPLGRTLAIQSVCILPGYQGLGLGNVMLNAYLQRMADAKIADHAALVAPPELVGYYVGKFGFHDKGPSKVALLGTDWQELIYEFYKDKEGKEDSGIWSGL